MRSSQHVELWLDASLSRHFPRWVQAQFGVKCRHLPGLGLREREDHEIFAAARAVRAVIVTKDRDFAALQVARGAPPQIILLTCGNASNRDLKRLLNRGLPFAIAQVRAGAPLIELT